MTIISVTSNPERTDALIRTFAEKNNLTAENINIEVSDKPLSTEDREDLHARTNGTITKLMDTLNNVLDDTAVIIDVDNVPLSSYLVLSASVKININPPETIHNLLKNHLVSVMVPIGDTLMMYD